MIINALVLGAILEADLGLHRKSSWFGLARPLVLAAVLVPVYFKGLTTHGTDVSLELAAAVAGLLLGLVLTAVMARPRRESRSGGHRGVGYEHDLAHDGA